MKKFAAVLIFSIFVFFAGIKIASADSVMLSDGTIIKGKIVTVLSGLIEIKTDKGIERISRSLSVGEARDIVEYGFLFKKRLLGEISYLDDNTLEIITSAGNFELNRLWVRHVILSRQIPLDQAPHYDNNKT